MGPSITFSSKVPATKHSLVNLTLTVSSSPALGENEGRGCVVHKGVHRRTADHRTGPYYYYSLVIFVVNNMHMDWP